MKRIITAAVTGSVHTPSMSPHLPVTPQEIAEDALRAADAGAAAVHLHVRDPETGAPSSSHDLYQELFARISAQSDVIIGMTTGGGFGMTPEERVAGVARFRPEIASFNMGTMNFGLHHIVDQFSFRHDWERDYLLSTRSTPIFNSFEVLEVNGRVFAEAGTRPELEVYDTGMVNSVAHILQRQQIDRPLFVQFVLGVLGGASADMDSLMALVRTAQRKLGQFEFSVGAAGRMQMPMCTAALLMGGHVRVGLEDNLFLDRGVPCKSSAEQVDRIVRIMGELGLEPASPAEARAILSLKGKRLYHAGDAA